MDEKLKAKIAALLGDQPLTSAQVLEKLEQTKDLSLVDGAEYAPKADLAAKAQELAAANQTISDLQKAAKEFDGKDPKKLADDLNALQQKYDTDTANIRRDAAIDLALVKARVRDTDMARAKLDMESIQTGKNGEIIGLDSQLASLKKDKAWLFEDAEPAENQPNYTPPAGGKPNTVSDLTSALAEHYNP